MSFTKNIKALTTYGFWSIIPSILAITLALRTRQIYLSLIAGIWIGYMVIEQWNPLTASFATIHSLVSIFGDAGNTRTVLFTLLVGALLALMQKSGGVEGLIQNISSNNLTNDGRGKRKAQLYASLTGLLIFVESNISILSVGAIFRPLFDKLNISREKLAYLADSSSAPSCIIFPFNAWGAYIMGLLMLHGIDQPFGAMMNALMYNFYPFLAIAMVGYIIFSGKDFGYMKTAESRAQRGQVLAEGATPMITEEVAMLTSKPNTPKRMINMILPMLVIILSMPLILIYTGWANADKTGTITQQLLSAVSHGSGSTAVLYAMTIATIVAVIMYKAQGILSIKDSIDTCLKGMSGMTSLALLMVLAFSIGSLCKELQTGLYVAELSKAWLSPKLVPAVLFLVSCFIAFSTGTSWGTFAIMLSIAIPMADSLQANVYMAIAAAIGGGVFGDHCSPISDTTIIASMASATDHIDHVKTQLPYALVAGGATLALYLLLGLL